MVKEDFRPNQKTTAQSLASLIKSCRDIMRKDKGLSGDLDRLPMLTWIMFLKFLDDMEHVRETEAELAGKRFRPAIEPPYRWRDWAAKPDGITGDALISFINNEESMRPDGKRGLGLFAYLRSLQGTSIGDRRDVIRTVFLGTINRMINGYLLRDVINKINAINFTSTVEIHTLSHLYESMLKAMRDAAGDSGEFYTPRPLIRFIVKVTNPKLGETILDPAAGTGGFLVESFEHLKSQCKTTDDHKKLQEQTLYGIEAKPLPYLLCQMNLLLHGLEYPNIDPYNALRFPLWDIGDKERVDIILTNPPFGGEEERGILSSFPKDKQTTETALLFLQLIMRKLKRLGRGSETGGRAGVIVPNGTLYATGITSRIRKELITNYNLHTVVRLPKGIFEPYADIPTNILFFDTSRKTEIVWFYEHPLPPHRAVLRSPCYSLSDPLQFEEFQPLIDWWENRELTPQSWTITVEELASQDYNLDQKNPNVEQRKRVNLTTVSNRLQKEKEQLEKCVITLGGIFKEISDFLDSLTVYQLDTGNLGELCHIIKGKFPTKKTEPGSYTFVVTAAERRTAESYQFDAPAVCIPMVSSTGHGHAAIHRIHYESGKFALANIMAALVVKEGIPLRTKYLYYYLWHQKEQKLVSLMAGTANTSLTITKLETVEISYPDLDIQDKLIDFIDDSVGQISSIDGIVHILNNQKQEMFFDLLHASFEKLG